MFSNEGFNIYKYIKDLIALYSKCREFREKHIQGREKINVILGAANSVFDGWISTDIDVLDITRGLNWRFLFKRNSINAILAEHVWEHLDDIAAKKAAINCYKYLTKSGYLRVAVPDGFHPDLSYIEHVKPGGTGSGSDTHRHLYNYVDLSNLLEATGFKTELLEYWDEHGHFHHKEWNKEDGYILRSMNYDDRNRIRPLSYTSLIVDAKK